MTPSVRSSVDYCICCRSTRRQRTTPWTARSGPVSTTSASCASCSAERRGGWPFDQRSLSPSGPRSLKRCTQSRSVWRSMPPIRAASARLIPSSTAASDSRRRLWLACLDAAASRRSSSVEKSALTVTAVAMARILPRHGISSPSRGKSPASQNGRPLVLERNRGELVRSFVREACLCDEIPLAIAASAADHTAEVWRALCEQASPEPVRLLTDSSGHELKIRILLRGYSRFSALAFQDSTLRADAAIAWRPRGIDGWEVSIHHRLGVPETLVTRDEGEPSAVAAIHSSTDYIIESPRKEDAPALARCFLKVYGHHYVHSEVFSPRRYWAKIERGELVPVIARDTRGDVVGHVALEREPGAKVAERGEAVVDPDHRGRGLLERMTECLSDKACTQGLDGIYAEPLTIHTFSQRNDERVGMPVCAALLGVNPEKFGPKNMHSTPIGQRQSYLRTFRFVRPTAPRTLQAPDQYRDILSELYADLS